MYIVDGHCDTLLALAGKNERLNKNSLQIDLESINKTKENYLQFYAIFVSPSIKGQEAVEAYKRMHHIYHLECELNQIKKIEKREDLNFKGHAGLLSVEGMYFMDGDYKKVEELYEQGVRCMSLTWNHDNLFSGGISGKSGKGLSKAGKKAVKKANKLGILLDVSHNTDQGFWDMIELSKDPVIATHSNSRALCSHSRNLDDDMLLALHKKGGLTGINVFNNFLSDHQKAGIKDIIAHIEHIAAVASIEAVGFGTDFDGIPRDQSAIDNPEDVMKVFEEMAKLNYSQEEIEKVAGLNYLRVLKKVLK